MIQLRNILLPTDFSETSWTASVYALELAVRFEAKLHLLHVIEDPTVYLPALETYTFPTQDEMETYAATRLENWALPDVPGGDDVPLERRWRHGTPFVQIVNDAREHHADLVVMGTHGRGIAAHLLMGSVAESVVRKAPCPVLTVRPEGHQFVHP